MRKLPPSFYMGNAYTFNEVIMVYNKTVSFVLSPVVPTYPSHVLLIPGCTLLTERSFHRPWGQIWYLAKVLLSPLCIWRLFCSVLLPTALGGERDHQTFCNIRVLLSVSIRTYGEFCYSLQLSVVADMDYIYVVILPALAVVPSYT